MADSPLLSTINQLLTIRNIPMFTIISYLTRKVPSYILLSFFLLGSIFMWNLCNALRINPMFTTEDINFIKLRQKIDTKPNVFAISAPLSIVPQAQAGGDFENARAYIGIDFQTGKILDEKNPDMRLPIASLTKVMSAVVTLDLIKPNDTVTISPTASSVIPTKIGVVAGQTMTVHEILEAMLMTSANDAAQAIADHIDSTYGSGSFVRAMNEKARFLGLQSTHFANPQGFDNPVNYSSVKDLVILSHYALSNYPEIASIVKKEYDFLPQSLSHKQFDLYNWNGLLGVYPGAEGMKIGNTEGAGYTIIMVSERDTHTVLAVLLGAPGLIERDLWTAQFLDTAFGEEYHLSPAHVTISQLEKKYSTWKYGS